MIPVLGYYDFRGFGDAPRLLLLYSKVDFQDKRYPLGPAPDYERKEWLQDKYNLNLDFPNLPYYIDDDVKITQVISKILN